MSTNPRVVIIGGGLAGLATAVALAQHKIHAVLLESRPRLGGRASSFHDAASNTWIDNCQHVTMGCCTNFSHFCELAGLAALFREEPVLYFVGPGGRIHRFADRPWPAPLHLAGALLRLSYLSWSDMAAIARGLRALSRESERAAARAAPHASETGDARQRTFAEWLHGQQQPPNAVRYFWHVVLVSALSESMDRISVNAARKVFVDGFLAHRKAWRVRLPMVPLEELYGGQLANYLAEHGVHVRLQTAVDRVELAEGRVAGVRLKSGELLTGDEFVVAVPHHRVLSLLPRELWENSPLADVQHLETAPITSVHLWFDRPIMDLPLAVFVTGLCQWIFNKSKNYYQVVISASRDVVERDSSSVLQQVLSELATVWPVVRDARLLHARQVTEHRAVFSPLPGSDALRPPQQSPIPNLQLAGDWTRTGWPATMEGAIRSGYLATENVLRRLGRPATIVRPDLPRAALFRWLCGG